MTKRRRLQEPLTLETRSLSELISTLYTSSGKPPSVMNIGDIDQGCLQEKAVELQNVIQKLHGAIDAARQFSAIQSNALDLIKHVLDHSHRTSYTTGAPLGYVPGKSALYMVKPPAPQTAQFQNSILHTAFSQHEKPMYMEKHGPAEKEKEKKQEEKNTVELLKQLPPMPKEWKPGDPIPGVEPVEKKTKEVPPSVDKAPKKPASNFAFSLNPDMDVEFDIADSSDDDSSSDDDY